MFPLQMTRPELSTLTILRALGLSSAPYCWLWLLASFCWTSDSLCLHYYRVSFSEYSRLLFPVTQLESCSVTQLDCCSASQLVNRTASKLLLTSEPAIRSVDGHCYCCNINSIYKPLDNDLIKVKLIIVPTYFLM